MLLDQPHHDGGPVHVPAGTPAPGARVPVRVRVPAACRERGVHVRTVRDGEPHLAPARLDAVGEHERWYVAEVEVHNPVTPYRFLLDEPGGYRWLNGTGAHDRDVPDRADFRLAAHHDVPAWAREAVVYQVFPDRFASSGRARAVPPWAVPAAWDDEPAGPGPLGVRQLYGGDLPGVEQHLDHLVRLGVNTLYLTPFFPAGSNHRYDATSFDHVDPLLGGDEALVSLARAVHARGMRILGDLTTNHTGAGHPWFRTAQADRTTTEASFYHWTAEGHVGWLGHASLPKLDHSSPALARRLTHGPDSVVARWLRPPFALDGWRVDVANMTGRYGAQDLTHAVARAVRRTATQANPEALVIAEHFHDAGDDLPGDGWHATMNYSGFARPVWAWLSPDASALPALGLPVPQPRRGGGAVVATLREFAAAVPWSVTTQQWNLLGSHDTPRIASVVADPALVEVAVALLVTYPGTPVVFAGDEIGATGADGGRARSPMPWDRPDRWDDVRLATYRALLALRRSLPALRDGGLRWVAADDDALVFLRETPEERVLVAVARAPWSGVDLPEHLAAGPPQTLHGSLDLAVRGGSLAVPGDGPHAGIWRLS